MSNIESNFISDAQKRFEGVSRERLKEYATLLGVDLKGNLSDDNIRLRLISSIGQIAPEASQAAVVPQKERPTVMPNVTPIGRWGGRCHDVTVFRPQGDNSPGIPIRWDEMLIYVPFADGKTPYTIPEPHYNILKDGIKRTFTTHFRTREDKSQYVERVENEEPTYPFQDGGITPGTEHLPGSTLEWYQWEAERKNYFKKFTLSRLQTIYSEISGLPPSTRINANQSLQWDREACLKNVLTFLGPKYLAELNESEEMEEAA